MKMYEVPGAQLRGLPTQDQCQLLLGVPMFELNL